MAMLCIVALSLICPTHGLVSPLWNSKHVHISYPLARCTTMCSASCAASDQSKTLLHASVLGVGTACLGTAYARCLKASVSTVWTMLPASLPLADPTLFIPLACTLGGLVVGLVSTMAQGYTMADLIGSQQSKTDSPGGQAPLEFIGPVLLLSLLTSTFGFSVGPEAPMVVAGRSNSSDQFRSDPVSPTLCVGVSPLHIPPHPPPNPSNANPSHSIQSHR